jgi:hypothetical protein
LVFYRLAKDGGLLTRFGKHRLGKGCVCIRRLDAAKEDMLRALIAAGQADLAKRWTVLPAELDNSAPL